MNIYSFLLFLIRGKSFSDAEKMHINAEYNSKEVFSGSDKRAKWSSNCLTWNSFCMVIVEHNEGDFLHLFFLMETNELVGIIIVLVCVREHCFVVRNDFVMILSWFAMNLSDFYLLFLFDNCKIYKQTLFRIWSPIKFRVCF